MKNKIEILAPAGAFESVKAAVRTGASAVYIGAKIFSARASADNFNDEDMELAVRYCHERGVKLYLALNTLIRDDEMPLAIEVVRQACACGADALIVQDLGLASIIKKLAPNMPLHASTQMSVHTPDGARMLYSLGFKRVVLARELSREEICEIVSSCPIETEVFVHGALCMCVSGQCEFSAMLGGRSGNRGRCAQPCRLPFAVSGGNGAALSLKDLSLLEYLKELEEAGVTSAKIEGRMKRPEYVAAATNACRAALDGKLKEEERERLEAVFSRSGFTDGYYKGNIGMNMFGVRSKENVTAADKKLLNTLKGLYKDERQSLPISFKFILKKDREAELEAASGDFSVCVRGEQPQEAQRVELSEEKAKAQLNKIGGTPFFIQNITLDVDKGLAFPLSAINAMRRKCVAELENEYCAGAEKYFDMPTESDIMPYKTNEKLKIRARFADCKIPDGFQKCEMVFVPLFSREDDIKGLIDRGFCVGAEIPRCIFGKEEDVKKKLGQLRRVGVEHALVSNIGVVDMAKELGFVVHGSFALNAYNTDALNFFEDMGLCDIELSLELTEQQMKTLGGTIKRGVVSVGRAPLMVTRTCPMKNGGQSCHNCVGYITDRKNNRLPLKCDGITTEVLNPVTTYAQHIFENANYLDFVTLRFSVETEEEILKLYNAVIKGKHLTGEYTNGLYKRGVI